MNPLSVIKLLPPLYNDGPSAYTQTLTSKAVVLPCMPSVAAENTRIVPDSGEVGMVFTDESYMKMIKHVQGSLLQGTANGATAKSWHSGCLVSSQIYRAADEESLVKDASSKEYRRGVIVRLKGLQRNPELNGRLGKLLYLNRTRGRWDVSVEDGGGIKAIKEANMELMSNNVSQRRFDSWRSHADRGGVWQLAKVGVLLRLKKLEEITTIPEDMNGTQVEYKCTFSSIGRVRLGHVLNPAAYAEGSTHLLVEADELDDDLDTKLGEHETRVVDLLKEIIDLRCSAAENVSILPQHGAISSLSAESGVQFWKMVTFWETFQKMQLHAAHLKSAVDSIIHKFIESFPQEKSSHAEQNLGSLRGRFAEFPANFQIEELPPALRNELEALQVQHELSVIDRKVLDVSAPLQQLIQAESHAERLQILLAALVAERERASMISEDDVLSDLADTASTFKPHLSKL